MKTLMMNTLHNCNSLRFDVGFFHADVVFLSGCLQLQVFFHEKFFKFYPENLFYISLSADKEKSFGGKDSTVTATHIFSAINHSSKDEYDRKIYPPKSYEFIFEGFSRAPP